jgi:hypothetical protein
MQLLKTCLLCTCFLTLFCEIQDDDPVLNDSTFTAVSVFEDAFKNQKSNIQVKQSGIITAVLSDDNDGDRHQRMIVRLTNEQTLLIAHNIDLSPRVPNPVKGKSIKFYGEYEWNSEGGVIHWTHKDPNGTHLNGWLEYEGLIYE